MSKDKPSVHDKHKTDVKRAEKKFESKIKDLKLYPDKNK